MPPSGPEPRVAQVRPGAGLSLRSTPESRGPPEDPGAYIQCATLEPAVLSGGIPHGLWGFPLHVVGKVMDTARADAARQVGQLGLGGVRPAAFGRANAEHADGLARARTPVLDWNADDLLGEPSHELANTGKVACVLGERAGEPDDLR